MHIASELKVRQIVDELGAESAARAQVLQVLFVEPDRLQVLENLIEAGRDQEPALLG